MKTKNILVLAGLSLILVAVVASSFVLAEETATDVAAAGDDISGDVSVNADSSMYGLKLGWEKIGLAFTFNQEKKAEKEIALASKRLVEARVMAEKGNEKGFARAQEAHDALIERAQARLEAINGDSKSDKIKESVKSVNGLQVAIDIHEAKIAALKETLAQENITDEKKASIEALIDKMESKNEAFRQKIEDKKDKAKIKLMAVDSLSETEVETAMKKIDNETKVTEVEMKLAERRIENANDAISKVEANLAKLKAKGTDVSAAETKVIDYRANIATAQASFDAGDYAKAIAEVKPVSNYGRQNSAIVKAIVKARQDGKDVEVEAGGNRVKVKAGSDSSKDSEDSEDESEDKTGVNVELDNDSVDVTAGTGDVIAINS